MIEAAIAAQLLAHARLKGAVAGSLAGELGEFHDRSDRARAVHAARTRWLHRHDAVASFPAGVVLADLMGFPPEARDRRTELAVIAAVLPETVSFLVDPPERFPAPDPIEAGAIPRDSLAGIEVRDPSGAPVPEPSEESLDAEPDVTLVLTWDDAGASREQRLVFRSSWLAWRAARRFRETTLSGT